MEVSVSCCSDRKRTRITVTDTGNGIAKEDMWRLFSPFERLGADQSGVEGSGLGLALSKRLMELVGGTIGVESTVGSGSSFWIEFQSAPTSIKAL